MGLKQDSSLDYPCKIGFNSDGWIGYLNNGTAFIKYFDTFTIDSDTDYPDKGCNVESYTCKDFCEIETVAPLFELEPDDECEHVEIWQGLSGLPELLSLEDVEHVLEPMLLSTDELMELLDVPEDDDEDECSCGCHHHDKWYDGDDGDWEDDEAEEEEDGEEDGDWEDEDEEDEEDDEENDDEDGDDDCICDRPRHRR